MYLPKKVERELKKIYGTVIIGQIVAAITLFGSIFILIASIDYGGEAGVQGMLISICMIITALLIYLITQLVDDSRRSSILLRYLLLKQMKNSVSDAEEEWKRLFGDINSP